MEQDVLFSVDNEVALIVLNRPQKHNAINRSLAAGLLDCLESVAGDDSIQAAIITGKGKSFCSGIDLDAVQSEEIFNARGDGLDFPDLIRVCQKPIIGAINGAAITGGFEIALNCDFLIASERASFADTHANVGIHPGWGMTQLLQECIGQRRAKQLSLTCQSIGADRACRWGLVNEVVPHEMLLSRAQQIAGDICSTNRDMRAIVKSLIEYRNGTTLSQACNHERDGFNLFLRDVLESKR